MKSISIYRVMITMLGWFILDTACAQWEYVGSPEYFVHVGFASDGQYTYLATAGRIYYTSDGGFSWHLIPNHEPFINIRQIKVVEGKLYVLADGYGRYDQLFVSKDQGMTWERIEMYLQYGTFFNDFVVRGDTMIVSIDPWLLTSYDGGKTTAKMKVLPTEITYFSKFIQVDSILIGLIGTGNTFWRSSDLGATWTRFDSENDFNFKVIDGVLWRRMKEANMPKQILSRSFDGGLTWEDRLTFTSGYFSSTDFTGGDGHVIVFDRAKKQIYHSVNGGDTFTTISSDIQYRYWFEWCNGQIYCLDSPFASYSIDFGATWTNSNRGIMEQRVESIVLPGKEWIWLTGSIYSSTNGSTWLDHPDSPSGVATSGNGHMVGVKSKQVYLSEDYGATWTPTQVINVLDPLGPSIYYLGGKFIIVFWYGSITQSTDGGMTWSNPIQPRDHIDYFGYNQGMYYFHDGGTQILASSDAIEWHDITYNIHDLELNSQFDGLIYTDSTFIIHNRKPYRLPANSQHWISSPYVSDTLMQDYNLPEIQEMKQQDSVILSATNGMGAHVSYDAGLSWVPFNDGLTNLRANCVSFDSVYAYLGMYNGGIWKRPIADMHQYNVIRGNVFYDENLNGVRDTLESLIQDIVIASRKGHSFVSTDTSGNFTLYTNISGIDTIEARPSQLSAIVTTPPVETNGTTSGLTFGVYFDKIYDVAIDIEALTMARPGFEFILTLSTKNNGSFPADMDVVLCLDTSASFLSTTLDPITVSLDSITWMLGEIEVGGHRRIDCHFYLPGDFFPGDTLKFKAVVRSHDPDNNLDNNTSVLRLVAGGAYDPNEKRVFPEGPVTPQKIRDTTSLTYTILFQNKGNYRADNIRLVDTISTALELNSLRAISASHPFEWRLRQGRILEVFFKNIFLPYESADEPGSHGFFKYSISPVADLKDGDVIMNEALIFFDYNPPIVTNQTQNEIKEAVITGLNNVDSIQKPCSITAFPNPATGSITLAVEDELKFPVNVDVYDITGKWIFRKALISESQVIDVSWLPSGLYHLQLINDIRQCAGDFVK